jgi:sporulation protein YlmC with PRC-barrel domain
MFGELANLVVDPTRRRVTHLVVQPRDQEAPGPRLVPVELAETGEARPEITLHCTVEDVRKLETVREFAFLELDGFPVDDPDWDVGVSDMLAMPYYGAGEAGALQSEEVVYDRVPKGEVEVRRSSSVISTDGHHLGHVEALILDEEEQVTHIVLERGHLWGQRDVTIPIGAVTKIDTDVVTVGLSKDEVGALPAVRVHRW